jgi:hypothetical protein
MAALFQAISGDCFRLFSAGAELIDIAARDDLIEVHTRSEARLALSSSLRNGLVNFANSGAIPFASA